MNTVRFAGAAGRIVGTAVALINWAEVLEIVTHGLQVLIVLCLLAGLATRRCWDALLISSERFGHWYAAWLVQPEPAPPRTVSELSCLTNRELRQMLGIRRRLAKRQLIALALAA